MRNSAHRIMLKSLQDAGRGPAEKARWNYQDDSLPAIVKVLSTDGTLAMVLYRLMQGSRELGLSPLEMVFNKLNSVFGNAVIGRGRRFRSWLRSVPLERRRDQQERPWRLERPPSSRGDDWRRRSGKRPDAGK